MAGKPGRREQPLDPQNGPLERLALRLRELRERAGLTYAEMADVAHYASSTLSQAAAGHRLPTRQVLLAYVRACGEDPDPWGDHWERVRRDLYGPEAQRDALAMTPYGAAGREEGTSFVGRGRELAEGCQLIERCRVLTLVGVGGVGKTRLAKHLVRQAADRFAGGTYCVELADRDGSGDVVAGAVAAAVGVGTHADLDPLAALAARLRGRRVLLLLDNCEHLLDESARTINALLASLPELHVLATSRQPLDIGEEQVFQVRPLGLPAPDDGHPDEASDTDGPHAGSPAVTLFADRAAAASPGFRTTAENRHTVAQVCRKLDGLPLALEIAARRLRTLTLDELLERLDHRFRLLGPGGRDRTAHPRHQALRALFDWSYELCTADERAAWQQLSLCSGGVLITDAEHLCGHSAVDGTQEPADGPDPGAFETLAGLVDKSLLTRADVGGHTRFHMLETVRAYGQERLKESGRALYAQRRHRARYLGLAAQAGAAYGSPEQAGWLRRLRCEHANLRQVVTAPAPAGEPAETVLRACLGLWLHCLTSGNVGEGARWMRMIIQRHPLPPTPRTTLTWCRAVWVAGFLLIINGDRDSADEVIGRGERMLAEAPAPSGTADAAAFEAAGDELRAAFLQLRALAALVIQETESAVEYSLASLAAGRWSTMLLTQPQCTAQLGLCAIIQGDRARAISLIERALAMSEARGDTWHRCYLLWILAITHGESGQMEEALSHLHHALRHTWEIDEQLGEASLSETLAWLLASSGKARSAAVVLGAVDGVWQPSGVPRHFGFAYMAAHRERGVGQARRILGVSEYARAYQEGQRLGLRNVLERVLVEGLGTA
ncbi:ATP-binding protein [Streptomyces sp. NBC_01423]|uniref:ATP-binding protein n=1 Tax=Streptomyces sp. NBC_01423 TaxID=2903860 RepID=UPI002E29A8F4|nr:helix-turn-helix domain-containing protein [Streptomyces sp. NBC_01423]